jgi:hypothetical protein
METNLIQPTLTYKSTFTHLENKIVNEYKKVQSLRKVGEKLGPNGPSHETISKILKCHNVPLRKVGSWEKLTEEKQNKIINKYNGNNISKLASQYNVCSQTIVRILKNNNIPIKPNRKYTVDVNVFNSLTPESSYWLGYLYGRGNVKSDYHLNIVYTNSYQKERVEKFKQFIKSNQPVKEATFNRNHEKTYKQKRLIIGSKTLIDKLKNLGLKPITHISLPQQIESELIPDFIRGLFDARGRFSIKHSQPFMFFLGNKLFLLDIQQIIQAKTGITGDINAISDTKAKLIYKKLEPIKQVINFIKPNNSTPLSKQLQEFITKNKL